MRMNQDGITVLTSSYIPYNFSAQGMSKDDGQHYKASAAVTRRLKAVCMRNPLFHVRLGPDLLCLRSQRATCAS